MSPPPTPVLDSIAAFIAGTAGRNVPPDVIEAARLCLVDWTGAALGGAKFEQRMRVLQPCGRGFEDRDRLATPSHPLARDVGDGAATQGLGRRRTP